MKKDKYSIDLTNIKAVVFDFDDTLYCGGNWSNYFVICSDFLAKYGLGKNANDVYNSLKEKYPNLKNFGMRVCNELKAKGIDVNLLYNYLNENIYDITNGNLEFMDYEELRKLSKLLPIYLVSNSPENYIKHYAKEFGIDLSMFKKVFYNLHEGEDYTKTFYIKKCISDAGILPSETLMVGDDETTDIEAAMNAETKTFLVQGIDDTKWVINSLIQLNQKK
jgi:HAD superfamily hydrolase (TIGR01549 family)